MRESLGDSLVSKHLFALEYLACETNLNIY
jgi:hypothetical protein